MSLRPVNSRGQDANIVYKTSVMKAQRIIGSVHIVSPFVIPSFPFSEGAVCLMPAPPEPDVSVLASPSLKE